MPLNSPNNPNYPCITYVLEMDERDRKGGRIEKGDRTRDEIYGRGDWTHNGHRNSPTKEKNFIS